MSHANQKSWEKEAAVGMQGWDFQHLAGRWSNSSLPWNYTATVLQYLKTTDRLLDMSTGGGELLQSFHHPNQLTTVTESWPPNIQLLQKTLASTGVHVLPTAHEADLPKTKQPFNVITNSHGTFEAQSLFQALAPGGYFITEQVGATNNFSLSRYLSPAYTPAYPDNTLLVAQTVLQNAGFKVLTAQQAYPELKFFDVGAIVYYATVIPWEFPDFSVTHCLEQLETLQDLIQSQGYIATNEDRFLIVAKKLDH
ncbi:SAM-dependent methyltransferase [Agrilactobacillus fermenti]|uniref:SAM-dependent methyltransferase n=1 Tax=Agrilactobacillus fermenti TaxID=2586909 RepID=UPI003A5C3550